MKVFSTGITNLGKVRENNEDNFYINGTYRQDVNLPRGNCRDYNWDSNLSGKLYGYQISKSTKKNGTKIVATYKAKKGLQKKAIKATGGTKYFYKIRGYKFENGKRVYTPWSYPEAYKIDNYKAGVLGKPKNFQLVTVKKDTCTLKWSPVKNAKGYIIYVYKSNGKKKELISLEKVVGGKKTQITIKRKGNLFRIKAYNDVGAGNFSDNEPAFAG